MKVKMNNIPSSVHSTNSFLPGPSLSLPAKDNKIPTSLQLLLLLSSLGFSLLNLDYVHRNLVMEFEILSFGDHPYLRVA